MSPSVLSGAVEVSRVKVALYFLNRDGFQHSQLPFSLSLGPCKYVSIRNGSVLYFNYFFPVRAPAQLLGWVEERDEGSVRTQTALAQLVPSTSSGVYILASYLFSMISFSSLGLGDNLPLLLPNRAKSLLSNPVSTFLRGN